MSKFTQSNNSYITFIPISNDNKHLQLNFNVIKFLESYFLPWLSIWYRNRILIDLILNRLVW